MGYAVKVIKRRESEGVVGCKDVNCLCLNVQISAPDPEEGFTAEFALNVLWLDKSIGLAVDQIFKNVRLSHNPRV